MKTLEIIESIAGTVSLISLGYMYGTKVQRCKDEGKINSLRDGLETLTYLIEHDILIVNPALKEEEA